MISSLFAFIIPARLRRGSLLWALHRILGSTVVNEVLSRAADVRSYVYHAAQITGSSEVEIRGAVGRLLNLPVIEELPERGYVAPSRGVDLIQFSESLSAPVFSRTGMSAIFCIDPYSIQQMRRRYPDVQLYLTSWENIRRIHQQFKAGALPDYDSVQGETQDPSIILRRILNEALHRKASTVQFFIQNGLFVFQFGKVKDPHLRQPLPPSSSQPLYLLLEKYYEEGFPHVIEETQTVFCVQKIAKSTGFLLQILSQPSSELCRIESATSATSSAQLARNSVTCVLIIEDDPDYAQALSAFITRLGGVVTVVRRAEEGLRHLTEGALRPTLLIGSGGMISGNSAFRECVVYTQRGNGQVLVLENERISEHEISALSVGVDAFLDKSCDLQLFQAYFKKLTSPVSLELPCVA